MLNVNSTSYKSLIVWQRAKELAVKIYEITKEFPKEEIYILTSQMKRAAISVTSNIAEGNQRRWKKDRLRFFTIAQGSLIELTCQTEIALDLGFIKTEDYKSTVGLLNKTGYLLVRLMTSEKSPIEPQNPSNPSNPLHFKKSES